MRNRRNRLYLDYKKVILSEKEKQMLDDDGFMDVTEKDILALLLRMARGQFLTEYSVRIRNKYDGLFSDRESEFIHKLGIHSYRDIRIDKSKSLIYINGYTESEWKMVNDYPDFHPSSTAIRSAIKRLGQQGDEDAVDIIIEKFGKPVSNWKIDSFNLDSPSDAAKYPSNYQIDNLTVNHCVRCMMIRTCLASRT